MSSGESDSQPEPIRGLHHFAWRCRDAEETRHFYEDILGLPLTLLVRGDYVPSTGEFCPHVHIFFRMGNGSYLAFFDLGDNETPLPSPNTPAWVNHLALEVDSKEALLNMKQHLEVNGIEVLGVTDHEVIESIYFFDPNGIRLEFAVRTATPAQLQPYGREAHGQLRAWVSEKAVRLAQVPHEA
jgi:catechol 2,3-dioxygenase-like lactoylglutathione lyase family enzyme